MRATTLCISFIVLRFALGAAGQASEPVFQEEIGDLVVRRDAVMWKSPESVASGLRSTDDKTRLRALLDLGLTSEQSHVSLWAQTSPSKVVGEAVVTPDQVRLTYAALGRDEAQQAVLSVAIPDTAVTMVAVAAPTRSGWQRLAAFSCWCKYEFKPGEDTLAEVAQLYLAPDHMSGRFELVLRASGGGTGVYVQDEAHFRVVDGALRRIAAFTSRRRSCDPTGPLPSGCTLELRWWYPTVLDGKRGAVLVHLRGQIPLKEMQSLPWSPRELENRYLREVTCTAFEWDDAKFVYVRQMAVDPCRARKP